nr:YqaJ viral recombinase family protein [Exiguobacterium sp. SL14]
MNIIANTKHMERSEWLALRNKGIGGSDAAVVAGLNKYKSPFTLFLEKTGQVVSDEVYVTDEDGAFLSGAEAKILR